MILPNLGINETALELGRSISQGKTVSLGVKIDETSPIIIVDQASLRPS